jgi:hypothetical protein
LNSDRAPQLKAIVSSLPFRLGFKNDYSMLEKFNLILAIAGLVGFIAMLAGVARADRKVKRAIAEGHPPSFSWAWFIFSIYIFAQGIYAFVRECLLEKHGIKGIWVNYLFQGLAILLLAVGITAVSNQVRWLLYILQRRG